MFFLNAVGPLCIALICSVCHFVVAIISRRKGPIVNS